MGFGYILVVTVLTAILCTPTFADDGLDAVKIIKQYDISKLRHDLKPNLPTADIVILHSKKAEITWKEMAEEFQSAYKVYLANGVQLNLVKAVEIDFPAKWNGVSIEQFTHIPTGKMEMDFYKLIDHGKEFVPPSSEKIFSQFIPKTKDAHRTIYVVTLSDLVVSWYEKNAENKWKKVSSKTSAISFPSYIFADRIPAHLRGIISVQRSKKDKKLLAHELGHKLINVSHEGLSKCPKGDGKTIPGLMGYGASKEIFGGKKGRWHKERLLKSPYLYKMVDGKKIWNKEYKKGGIYADPIYGKLIMKPACP